MDIVEINKYIQRNKLRYAENMMFNNNLSNEDALRLILNATKDMYGIRATINIIHALGVKHL